ncbi:hypothetical protein [uncultured Pseudoxanthomonas sp.]|uniref:hypothetical protein n=1 Tax=uncultured Pseudoxanthomonas sp. TaxID=281701 RepID=UPI00263987D1|nr:hypothetical protein [uncultured Pseudoxanthomonas sp.]
MTITRFRVYLIVSVILSLATIATVFLPDGYSSTLAEAYANEPPPWLFRHENVASGVGVVALALVIAGYVGLFMLKRWGRALSLGITVLGFPLYLLAGPTLLSPVEAMLTDASTLIWGVCLALAYHSPVATCIKTGVASSASS